MAMDSRELDSPLADLDGLPCDVRDLHDDLHIQAVVGSDRDSPGSLKRAGCDLGADGDLGTAKKRRKQSKPVRIDAGEGAAALGDALAEVLGDVVDNGGDARVSPSLDLEVQVHCQTEGEARDEIPLNLCSLPKTEPSSPTGLDDFGTFPTHAGLKSVSPGGGLDVDLAVQHQQSERMAMNNFWGMSPPFLYPMMAPQSEQGLSQGMPQGLQQGLPQGLQQGLPQGLPPGLPPGLPQGLQQGLPPGLSQGLSQGLPQGLTQSNNHQSRCSPDNRTGSCTIFNPDAYCELCNKEFCNKYFLKTHKANKHGIFTNSPSQVPTQQQQLQQLQQQPQQPPQPPQPSPQQQQSSPSSNDTYQHGLLPPRTLSPNSDSHVKLSSSPLRLQKDLISAKHGKNLFQRKIKVKSFGSNGEDVSLPPVVKVEDEYYDTDMDRLLSRMSPLQSADGLRDDTPAILKAAVQEDVGEGGSAGDSNESTGILRKEAVPPQEILDKPVFTPEKMRSLGVINPEAFCEICCKEYCNKYFLRTHKWKRHGIAPPEGEQDKQETQRPPAPSWLQQLQQHAAPLNLIMEEATNQGDAICKFCGQWFPSEQVLQVHVAFVHMTKKQDKEGGDPADMRKEPLEDKRGGERSKQMAPEQIESIMDDMKKVQTMLFQLNTLNNQLPGVAGEQQGKRSPGAADEARSGESPVNGGLPCAICKKTLPDKAALQQHVQEQHWSAPIKVERDLDVTPVPPGREAAAEQPQQQQQQQLQQPQPPPPPPPQPAEPKPTAPTSSYCEICNKELCNKYFMKTHMQRMHGIEIENGSQIGGVVCDICNKELCSKYFLRVHKQNTHGIVDETNGPPTQVRGDGGAGGLFSGSHFLDAGNQALKPTDLSEMSHRYFTHFNEVCSICNRRFRSVKWLKAHLMNDHGRSEYEAAAEANDRLPKLQPGLHPNDLGVQLGLGPGLLQGPGAAGPRERGRGEGKARHGRAQDGGAHAAKNGNHFMSNLMQVAGTSSKEYRCSYCPFSTPVLAFLYVHEKTHTGLAYMPEQKRELQCPICYKTCTKPEQFQRHLLSHQFAGLPGPGGLPGALWDPRNSVYAGHHKEPKREKQLPPPQQPAAPRGTPERDEDGADVDERVRFAEPARHREAPAEAKRSGKCPKCGGDLAPGERCAACGGGGKELSSLQSLLKETVTSDVKKRLEDAAKLNDIPATYAVPKTQDSDADPFIMQPFIIEEPRGEEGSLGVVGGAPPVDKKFVPSLVFLPVKERLSRPLTASFTLTPA